MVTLATIGAFFSTMGGQILLAFLAAPTLGLLSETALYKAARAAYGRFVFRVFASGAHFLKLRFGPLWKPVKSLFLDWFAFGAEQAAAGIRSVDPEELQDHLERLEGVGSRTRAKAIAEKLEALGRLPKPVQDAQDAAMFHRAFKTADESVKEKLGE